MIDLTNVRRVTFEDGQAVLHREYLVTDPNTVTGKGISKRDDVVVDPAQLAWLRANWRG